MMVLSFVGFLRYSEVSSFRRSDFIFENTYMKIFIEKSKTYIYRDGHWLSISKVNSEICPMMIIKTYLDRCEVDSDSNEFIFRAMSFFKSQSTYKLRSIKTPKPQNPKTPKPL